ncbi:MAG: hypothetical protein EZS28_031199, partial [Streblomastix strix]
MLEEELDEPILQVEAGRFLAGSKKIALAVLHPRRIVVYTVVIINPDGGQTFSPTEGCFYALTKNYEHKLPRNAHSFVYGGFGGAVDRDFICVQSIDGCFSFFEQEVRCFDRVVHDFLLPGPFCYLPSRDSFIIALSTMDILCLKYQSMAKTVGSTPAYIHNVTPQDTTGVLGKMAMGTGATQDFNTIPTQAHQPLPGDIGKSQQQQTQIGQQLQKQIKEEWRRNLGEHALQIKIGR